MSHKNKGLEEHMHGEHPRRQDRKLHRDWRIWLGVVLMLAAMAIYLLTMDEAIVPGNPAAAHPPATNAPAQP
jgi:4-amino-4-deoxy-L-arabinose transferase-like glycosyltransferase